jgi:uncharacterized repeat protein (TIGR01451 family)
LRLLGVMSVLGCKDSITVVAPICNIPVGSIGNFVFVDTNKDGKQDASEVGVNGVKVYLLNAAGAKIDSTITAGGGKYLFSNLPAGTYSVQFVKSSIPAIYSGFTTKDGITAGTTDANDSDADATTGKTATVTLAPVLLTASSTKADSLATNNMTLDAGVLPKLGSIGDYVFLDNDNSNTQSAGDTPVKDVVVYLLDNTGKKIDSTKTDATGKYLFPNLPLGTYSVQFVAPAGQSFVTPLTGGDPAKDSDAGVSGKSAPVTLTATTPDVMTVDAGIKPTPAPLGSIGNFVFVDTNKDGKQDATEAGVNDVKVYLLNAAGVKIDSTITAGGGKYLFSNLPAGTYSVQFVKSTIPAIYSGFTAKDSTSATDATDSDADKITGKTATVTLAPVVLTASSTKADSLATNNMTLDAGLLPKLGSIGDYVFLDNDNSNTQSAGDTPVKDVVVYLLDNTGKKIDSTKTDATGKYLFPNLPLGTYSVQFVAPAGLSFVTPLTGGDATKDSDAGVGGKSAPVTLTATTPDVMTVDAGIKPTPAPLGSIGNFVFVDTNKDGKQDATEAGVNDVKVYLLNAAGTKIDSTITAGGGKYLFSNLPAGTYSVEFVKSTIPAIYSGFTTKDGTTAGTTDANDSDADATTGKTATVTLAPVLLTASSTKADSLATNNMTLDAGLLPKLGSIGDYVFLDNDNSNTQSAGDTPVKDVVVYLLDNTGKKIDSTKTDATGKYLFPNLPLGTYSVQFVAPAGQSFVTPLTGGDPAKDSDAGVGGKSAPVTLTATTPDVMTVDAGLKLTVDINCVQTPPTSVLGASVDACIGKPYPELKALIVGTGTVDWYKQAAGGVAVATGTLNYTPSGNVAANDTFYLAARSTIVGGNCPAILGRTRIIVVAKACVTPADLALLKKIDKNFVRIGETVTFTLSLINEGKTNVTGVTVLDTLPSAFQYVSHISAVGTTYNAATGIWNVGNMAATTDTLKLMITAKVMAEGVQTNKAEIKTMDGLDKDSTPGNGIKGEDDEASVCVSVPIEVCDGKAFEIGLTAASGFSSYTWYRNGVLIAGATSNVYNATQDGDYTFVVTGGTVGTCQGSNCCPVRILKVSCPCPAPVCVPFTVKRVRK